MDELQVKVCTGCGTSLQTEHPGLIGYTPASTLAKEHPICQRCFRIKNYGEVAPIAIDADSFREILSGIGQTRALVIHVVDVFDVAGSWIDGIEDFIGQNPILLVANKSDLLPKQTNMGRTEQWLRSEIEKKGLHVAGVALISARKGHNIGQVKTWVERYAVDRDIYVVGTANVGKSTLINHLIGLLDEHEKTPVELTTSRFPGTTLSAVKINIPNSKHHLIDTPGIMTTHRLTDLVCSESLKLITPDKTLNPTIFQLNDQQTLFIGGLIRVDFVRGEHQSFVFYFANQLNIHRTKLENAEELYTKHVGELLQPPCAQCGDHLRDFVEYTFTIQKGDPKDIVISGLGWVSLRGEAALVVVHAPRGVEVSLRRAII